MTKEVRPRRRDRLTAGLAVWLIGVVLRALRVVSPHARSKRRREPVSTIGLDAGTRGWQIIEYEELAASAREYFGANGVVAISIVDRERYIRELLPYLRGGSITHFVYDPRTGSEQGGRGLRQCIALAGLLQWYGITPIGRITDVPVRRWRLQTSIVTAVNGVCVTLMQASAIRPFFPHHRVIGPLFMPISQATLRVLADTRSRHDAVAEATGALFTGSLYEPRTTYLLTTQKLLAARGIELRLTTRVLGEPRDPNPRYWQRLVDAGVVLTTADQLSGPGIDALGVPHLLYRYTEALAAGSLLVAPEVPGVAAFFRPHIDFVPCGDAVDAAKQIEWVLGDREVRTRIAENGFRRIRELVDTDTFWRVIDAGLGVDGFIRPTNRFTTVGTS